MLVVGVDVGTTNLKVALVDVEQARAVAVAAAPTPQPGHLSTLLAALLTRVLDGRPAPRAVGVASMAETGVPVGPDDEPRGGWLRWDSHRGDVHADALAARWGRAELFAATGVRASGKVPLATWAWLREHAPARLHDDGRWAGAADLVVLALTGRLVTDHTLAGRTMAYRLGRPGRLPEAFDDELLAGVGLAARHVPRVLAPGQTVPLRRGPATADLPPGIPVTVAGHDHAVAAFAAGVRQPGRVADSLGTAEVVCTVFESDPAPDPVAAAGMSLVRTVRGDLPALVAGTSSAGGAVAWWLATYAGDLADDERARLLAAASDARDDDWWRALRTREDAFLLLPSVAGRQTPAPDPGARPRPVGRVPADPVAHLRGLLVGLALQARWMLDVQAELAGGVSRWDSDVRLLGGPAHANPAWTRLKGMVTPAPVHLVLEREPVAVGAALLAAERAGLVDDAAVTAAVPVDEPAAVPEGGAAALRPGPGPRLDADRLLTRFVDAATHA